MSSPRKITAVYALLLLSFAVPLTVKGATELKAPPQSETTLPLTGRVFTDFYLPIEDLDVSPLRQSSASAWLQGDPRLGENSFARLILTAEVFEASNNSVNSAESQFRIRLREGYAGYAGSGLEFRAGRQIIPWGKSDAINPTDFLSAKDYTLFNPDEEVRRLGATSLWLSWTPSQGTSPLNFTVVATPVFPQSRLLIAPSVIPANVTLNATPLTPGNTLSSAETALKISYTASSWDASLIAFRGWNHMPELTLSGLTTLGITPIINVSQTFHRIRGAGADTSFNAGSWILRGESAYVWTENDTGENPLVQPSHFDAVLGAERPLGDDFRIQVQGIYRYFPAFLAPDQASGPDLITTIANRRIATANALLLGYQDKSRGGATFRISYTNEAQGIDTELFMVGNYVGGDYLFRPKFSYNWTPALKSTIGMDYYGGPDDRPLGALKTYNSLFLEGKYSF